MSDDAKRTPEMIPGVDVRALPLQAVDGFVMSRIDGRSTAQDISDSTGLGDEQVHESLERLIELGAVRWARQAMPPTIGSPTPPADSSSSSWKLRPPGARFKAGGAAGQSDRPVSRIDAKITRGKPAREGRPPGRPPSTGKMDRVKPERPQTERVKTMPPPPGTSRLLYDPDELEEEVDLDMDRRRAVLDAFYRLESRDHYQVLGVARDAEKAEIRTAYFTQSKVFHPDTLYGKQLGTYKSKMEKVFVALTEAYEVLSKKKKRRAYDAYLELTDQTNAARQSQVEVEREARSVERRAKGYASQAMVVPEEQAADAPKDPTIPRADPVLPPSGGAIVVEVPTADAPDEPASPASIPTMADGSPISPTVNTIQGVPPIGADGKSKSPSSRPRKGRVKRSQEIWKMRLGRNSTRPGGSSRPPSRKPTSSNPSPSNSKQGRDELLRGLASSLRGAASQTGGGKLGRQLKIAKDAEDAGDLLGAVNALRLAVALSGDDERIIAEHGRLLQLHAAGMADTYRKQAVYEEDQKKWMQAANSWCRVLDGHPDDIQALQRAANAFLEAGTQLKKARNFAMKAVEAKPDSVDLKVLLARIYMRAEMSQNARRELEAAAKLDPGSQIVKNLLSELK